MKLLSVAIPCYNSQEYMRKCIDSLLFGGQDVELLVVNDGSSDETAAIAEEYAAKFPDIVRAIHQENGGHGAAVAAGIRHATGRYFKVVDSDDWVDHAAYMELLEALRAQNVDMVLCNYVYEKVGKKHKKVMRYKGLLPERQVFSWQDVGRFKRGTYILMHSIVYRTSLLRECGLQLPRHTFYVDNLYAYIPLPYVKTMYYLDVDFYRYFIGRQDQSVHEAVMLRRIDQQLYVNRLMAEGVKLDDLDNPSLRRYMYNYLEIITTISMVLLNRIGTRESLQKKQELWAFLKKHNRWFYRHLRYGALGQVLNLPGRMGRSVSVSAYRFTQRVVGFN